MSLKSFSDVVLSRKHVCPWWLCFTFDNVFRKLFQDPDRILKGLVRPGDTVLDIGAGMGYFTIPLARLVGPASPAHPNGKVIAVDLQERMLAGIRRRAEKAGLQDRIVLHLGEIGSVAPGTAADFILLKENGSWLLSEPRMHVAKEAFETTTAAALQAGFRMKSRPRIPLSRAALFVKKGRSEGRL